MNQEEEVPTRVTRGALRRRSVDQEATPQKPAGAASSGTPKKSASTTKKVHALNAIQETEGRPSTPTVGRTTRRRVSETMDTPTLLPNKLVQNLKEAETSVENGRRSRNSSLTEENLNELNAAYDGSSGMMPTRSRTPARLRASHEALASMSSPQTAIRRSTRRNSVTSDDGSVHSLPVTTPKVSSGLRALKDDTIIEEDASDDRAESVSSEASSRVTRRQSTAVMKSASPSPRRTVASPVMNVKMESTPPRVLKTPLVALSPLTLPKESPRSKNVSFSDDSKQDDNISSFPKTPTSVAKEVVVVVEDLRNSELMGLSAKLDTEVYLPIKREENLEQMKSSHKSPKRKSVSSNAEQELKAIDDSKSILISPKAEKETIKQHSSAGKREMNPSTTVPNEDANKAMARSNDVSGIEVLDSSVMEVSDTSVEANTSVKDTSSLANNSTSEGNKLSHSWSQSVRRSATKGIDEFSVRKQEEQERQEEEIEKLQKTQLKSPANSRSPRTKQDSADEDIEEENDDEMEDEEEGRDNNEFIDDEAVEMEGYESGDSLASDLRKEMEENEIPDQGEDLGSEDTEENDDQEEDDEDGNDSWIVSSGEEAEQLDEDELLQDTEDEDMKTNGASLQSKEKSKTPTRRRIVQIVDDSDEDSKEPLNASIKETTKSPKQSSFQRSVTPSSVGANGSNTPSKTAKVSETTDGIENNGEDKIANTPAKNDASMASSGDVVEMKSNVTNPITPVRKTPSKKVSGSASNSAVKSLSNSKSEIGDNDVASGDENNTSENSDTMFQDAENGEETCDKSGKETNNDASLSISPAKFIHSSRKSLPAASVKSMVAIGHGRKSLPASANMQPMDPEVEKVESLQKSIENDDAPETVDENPQLDNSTHAAPVPAEYTLDQPANEADSKANRKSMPTVSLISAQFYIGGSKKRATINGGDANVPTSTPKANQSLATKEKAKKPISEKKATATNGGSSIVPNPFAQGSKVKSRLSLDSGSEVVHQKLKKSRMSLPVNLHQELMEVTEAAPMVESTTKETAKGGDDVEMMEEVVVVEEETGDGNQLSKVQKTKQKALEEYDLANILSRCNEVIREDKERKKEVASAIRKKKEEKKRMRELEKQQELEAANTAAASTVTDNDDGLNSSTTANDSASQVGEALKKKKKRKPKVKNYLLEELAATKKERLEQALRHKLEVIERRKQRKKERQLDQKKQLDKENGDGGNATGASGGIGAKLEKMKKKQKAKSTDEATKKSKEPPVRVALSAFAVFNQLQNNQVDLQSVQHKQQNPVMNVQQTQLVTSTVEAKQHKKSPKNEETLEQKLESKDVSKTPDKKVHADEKATSIIVAKKTEPEQTKKKTMEKIGKPMENQLGITALPPSTVDKMDDDVAAPKKQSVPAVKLQSVRALESDGKINPPLLKSVSDGVLKEANKLTKKQKRKLAVLESATPNTQKDNLSADVIAKRKEINVACSEDAHMNSGGEKRKEKKRKEPMMETISNDLASNSMSKSKKNKKQIAQNENGEDHSTFFGSTFTSAMHKVHTEEVKEKKQKKSKKQLAEHMENDTDPDRSTVEQASKKQVCVQLESTTAAPAAPATVSTKKRKRELTDSPATVTSTTPRPAKHTKLRVLQRIESGGFFEENVTPDKIRLKRNFGFQERQATPAKQLGFRVSAILPSDQKELRAVATKMHSKDGRLKSKYAGASQPDVSRSLPLPVWTSSGVFLEFPADDTGVNGKGREVQKQQQSSKSKTDTGYIQLKGQGKGDFRLKTLRPGPMAEKPQRVDPSTTEQSVLNFKRKQLLEKTAHLREKKKSHRV
uniref:Uncharacterized protein n=1 Tax=Anopheles christyi TaxID=43041 RepID=A0A182JWL5_9DIPT